MSTFFPFLTPAITRSLLRQYTLHQDDPNVNAIGEDEKALLFACLALGRLRQLMLTLEFDVMEGGAMGMKERHRSIAKDEVRWDAIWYRHALVGLGRWGGASMLALRMYPSHSTMTTAKPLRYNSTEAYTVMQLYCLCTTTLSAARHITDMIADQARTLRILRMQDIAPSDPKAMENARNMLFHVLFGTW